MSAFIPVAICAVVVGGGIGWLKMLWWDRTHRNDLPPGVERIIRAHQELQNSGGAVTGGLQCEADPSPTVPPE